MDPNIVRRFEQLQKQITQLSELATGLAAAAPKQTEGTDATGWVRVVIGQDALPRDIRIRNGWSRHINADLLGAAVMEANADAVSSAMRAWSDGLAASSWWATRHRLESDGPASASTLASAPPDGVARDPADLTEEILSALERVRQQQPAPPTTAQGSDPNRHVTVQLGRGGLVTCHIDPRWAANRDGDSVTTALSHALRAAAAQMSSPRTPTPDVDRLAADALATLKAAAQFPRPGGRD